MDLLPKSSSEFSQQQYWDQFFTKRGRNAFEWYGNYLQLSGLLHKYITYKDNVLMAGCGNSTLGADLYNSGFKAITNVDISETVINQMQEKYKQSHPEMSFVAMDLLQMTFPDATFSCVLDKGTLDALFSDSSQASQDRASNLLSEIGRVLRVGGRYICISLLQEHIAQKLVHWSYEEGWMIRVCRCADAEDHVSKPQKKAKGKIAADAEETSPFPVFVIVCTKFKKMPSMKPVIEFSPTPDTVIKLSSPSELLERIKSVQQFALLRHQLAKKDFDKENFKIDLMSPNQNSDYPRYTLYIIDKNTSKASNIFAAFIVPQGRETEWLFGTPEGRKQLIESADFQRLVVIHLNRGHSHSNLQSIQDELGGTVASLQPLGTPINYQIPFLSVGSDIGKRTVVHEGMSPLSGKFVIEDVQNPDRADQSFRRLIFLSNQNVVQSEARLLKNKVDLNYLACQHHIAMVAGLAWERDPEDKSPVLVLGLGGGALSAFIHKQFPERSVEAVDIDPAVVEAATKFFGFKPDQRLTVVVQDGLAYVNEAAVKGQKYYAILIDVDNKDSSLGISCPPPAFLETSFLNSLKACLNPEGLLLINFVCRDTNLRKETLNRLKPLFPTIVSHRIEDEVNEILYCYAQEKDLTFLKRKKDLTKSSYYQSLVQLNKKTKQEFLDVEKMLGSLKIE